MWSLRALLGRCHVCRPSETRKRIAVDRQTSLLDNLACAEALGFRSRLQD
jgi:hypothetical protein